MAAAAIRSESLWFHSDVDADAETTIVANTVGTEEAQRLVDPENRYYRVIGAITYEFNGGRDPSASL